MKKLIILGIDHGHYRKIIDAAEKRNDIKLTAIAQETDDSGSETAQKYNVKHYDSYLKCLDEEQPDIVGIAMFNGARGKWVIECMRRNITVIADKPICTELSELKEIKRIQKQNKTPLSMMLTCRCDPNYIAIKEQISKGTIGNILAIDTVRYYALNRSARPSWMFNKKTYGGPGIDILLHDYDLARWMTGIKWNDLKMCELKSDQYSEQDFEDMAFINSVDRNRFINLKMFWHSPRSHWNRFTVYGTKGVINFALEASTPTIIDNEGNISKLSIPDTKSFAEQFFDSIMTNDPQKYPISEKDIFELSENILSAKNKT